MESQRADGKPIQNGGRRFFEYVCLLPNVPQLTVPRYIRSLSHLLFFFFFFLLSVLPTRSNTPNTSITLFLFSPFPTFLCWPDSSSSVPSIPLAHSQLLSQTLVSPLSLVLFFSLPPPPSVLLSLLPSRSLFSLFPLSVLQTTISHPLSKKFVGSSTMFCGCVFLSVDEMELKTPSLNQRGRSCCVGKNAGKNCGTKERKFSFSNDAYMRPRQETGCAETSTPNLE